MVSTLKEMLDKMMLSLPVGGVIELEIKFKNLALSDNKVKREKMSRSRSRSSGLSRNPYRTRNFATETIGYCDEQDTYLSVDMRTDRLFPSAELIRKQSVSRASAKNRLRRAAERKIASRRKIIDRSDPDELLTMYPGIKNKTRRFESDPRMDTAGAYSDLDLDTDIIFPSATVIPKKASSSSSSGSVFSSNGSTYNF